MAIKTEVQGGIPAVDLDYLQYSQFNMTVSEEPPHKISVSGLVRAYGQSGGDKIYSKHSKVINIANLDAYIASLPEDKQLEAIVAMGKVQEGLGGLAQQYFGINFVGVE